MYLKCIDQSDLTYLGWIHICLCVLGDSTYYFIGYVMFRVRLEFWINCFVCTHYDTSLLTKWTWWQSLSLIDLRPVLELTNKCSAVLGSAQTPVLITRYIYNVIIGKGIRFRANSITPVSTWYARLIIKSFANIPLTNRYTAWYLTRSISAATNVLTTN